ncbi:MAG: alpha/beta hydrolase [Pseudomarimonas sp.]
MSKSIALVWLLAVSISAAGASAKDTALPQVTSGRIERLANFASVHVPARHVDVWLPADYPEAAPYAVLYMHDGQMLFDAQTTWNHQEWRVDEVAGELQAAGKLRPFIVVGIWNGGAARAAEYLPQRAFERLDAKAQARHLAGKRGDQPFLSAPVYSDRYLRFLVEELKPAIDQRFAVDPSPAATTIMGSSMGGLISLYAFSEYPQVFGAAACLSTHWPGGFIFDDPALPEAILAYTTENLPSPASHRLYFDHGTATLDAQYAPWQKRADAILANKGYTDANAVSRVYAGAEHSEQAWSARLHVPLAFLFAPRP